MAVKNDQIKKMLEELNPAKQAANTKKKTAMPMIICFTLFLYNKEKRQGKDKDSESKQPDGKVELLACIF